MPFGDLHLQASGVPTVTHVQRALTFLAAFFRGALKPYDIGSCHSPSSGELVNLTSVCRPPSPPPSRPCRACRPDGEGLKTTMGPNHTASITMATQSTIDRLTTPRVHERFSFQRYIGEGLEFTWTRRQLDFLLSEKKALCTSDKRGRVTNDLNGVSVEGRPALARQESHFFWRVLSYQMKK